ncbi:hypothetical protein [Leifsonia sp. TF02-11]|uniref:hypothetical protein n=1 Tax=Leifsonia sp. TF02-11 TaxID=2815212 RepID=UPI001AA1670C|nr:hypothetical protein [Leifsonia sp. TF02-11]MBO1737210.1 hypothetical protein [Leifsonia sp. TF02-11]
MRRRTKVLIATTAAVLVLASLAGGSLVFMQSVSDGIHLATAAAPTEVPTAVATPLDEEAAAKLASDKAAKGLTAGAVLTTDQAKAIGHYWQGNLLPYKMADGTQVLVARDQPLPESVKADAGKQVLAAAQKDAAANDYGNGDVEQAVKTLSSATGRPVVVVAHVQLALAPAMDTIGWAWVSTALGGGKQFPDSASAVAATQAAKPGATIIVSP